MLAELERLESHLGGVADMKRQPDAMLVVDLRKEAIAVREASRLGLPVVALVDTNCDPDEADYVVPGNDDAIKSCDLVIRTIADCDRGRQAEGQAGGVPGQAATVAEPAAEEPRNPLAEESEARAESRAAEEAPAAEEPAQPLLKEEPAPAPAEEVPAE